MVGSESAVFSGKLETVAAVEDFEDDNGNEDITVGSAL